VATLALTTGKCRRCAVPSRATCRGTWARATIDHFRHGALQTLYGHILCTNIFLVHSQRVEYCRTIMWLLPTWLCDTPPRGRAGPRAPRPRSRAAAAWPQSTFSRTVWRLYGGAKGIVTFYCTPQPHSSSLATGRCSHLQRKSYRVGPKCLSRPKILTENPDDRPQVGPTSGPTL
jgi:hypothetical protein